MPGNYQKILTNSFLANSASYNLDIDRINMNTPFLIQITTNAQLIVNIFDGFGNSDPTAAAGAVPVVFGGSSIPSYTTVPRVYTINGSQDICFKVGGSWNQCSRWIRLEFVNTTGSDLVFSVAGDF